MRVCSVYDVSNTTLMIILSRADLALDIAEMREADDVQLRRDIYINVSIDCDVLTTLGILRSSHV